METEEDGERGRGAEEKRKINKIREEEEGKRDKRGVEEVRKEKRREKDDEEDVGKKREAKKESEKAKAETDHAKAVGELEAAKRGIIVAETKVKTAANDLDRFREASNLLADPPGHAKAAVDHLKRLQGTG